MCFFSEGETFRTDDCVVDRGVAILFETHPRLNPWGGWTKQGIFSMPHTIHLPRFIS